MERNGWEWDLSDPEDDDHNESAAHHWNLGHHMHRQRDKPENDDRSLRSNASTLRRESLEHGSAGVRMPLSAAE